MDSIKVFILDIVEGVFIALHEQKIGVNPIVPGDFTDEVDGIVADPAFVQRNLAAIDQNSHAEVGGSFAIKSS